MDAFPPEEADPRASRLALTGLTLARPPEAPPGARFIYSNRNYIVAAAMLEAATGRPEDLMRERLFAPLAMEGAGFGPPELFPALPDPRSRSRSRSGRTGAVFPAPAGRPRLVAGPARRPPSPGVPPQDNPAVAAPAARLHAPMAAMIRFLEAHRTRAPAAPGDGTGCTPRPSAALRAGWVARRWQPVARWQQQPVDRASADNRIDRARWPPTGATTRGWPPRSKPRSTAETSTPVAPAAAPCTGPRRLTQSMS
jgi:CubicO group peptidase (beta-lactamase class C family)